MKSIRCKTIAVFFLTFFCQTVVFSFSNIKGIVLSNKSEPIVGAHIKVIGTMIGTISDINGHFEIDNLEQGSQQLFVSALGYKDVSILVEVAEGNAELIRIIFEEDEILFPEVLILGKSDRIFSKTPGSASFINSLEMNAINPISGNEVFRRSPGIHVVDEEGAGMRVNIGIRGLDPDRSRTLLMLEDGIPVALAPYGEPEMYYTPPIDRMSGVEILKGSGQIMYGPQTIGGVVNYLTQAPPLQSAGKIRLQTGQGGYLNGLLTFGNTFGNTGYQVTFLKKRADKLGLTAFDITDLNAKLKISLSQKSALSLKAGIYDESSNATYIGLTQNMYDAGSQDFTHMAPDDRLNVRRYSLSMIHDYILSSSTKLVTSAYAYTTTRDWKRQDFSSNTSNNIKPSNWTGITWGDESVPGGAVYMRNGTGNRNRTFEVAGIESKLQHNFKVSGSDHKLNIGIRYLYEKAYEQRINGSNPSVNAGALVEDETRPGSAVSAYVHNLSKISSSFDIHYGVRMEYFQYGRDINRRSFTINGQNVVRDTVLNSSNQLLQFIPGAGFTWRVADKLNIYGGVHTGFAPPRTKDAISNVGEVYNLDAEKSINSELGIRSSPLHGVQMELTAFYMNFSNQIIPVSESSGGAGTGLVNGGATIHQGIESALTLDIANMAGWSKASFVINTNITYVDAHFIGDRQQAGESLTGNSTPYAPSWLINSAVSVGLYNGFSMRVGSNFVGKQFTDELNSVEPSADGRSGMIPSYHTLDANVGYQVKKWNTSFSLAVKNITNQRYITSRRPQGIRVGLPTFVTFGIEHTF